MDTTVLVLVIVVVVLLIAAVTLGLMLSRRKRSERLREQFGPEYERSVSTTGDRKAAETDLKERQQRRSELNIRYLRPEERGRFQESWDSIQRGFVDDPARALRDADVLVVEIMRARGYPVEDFDRRADDISVDHPDVVHHYREARGVRDASAGGSVDTDQQRHAVTSYRSLVEALLGPAREERPAGRTPNAGDANHRVDDAPPTEERTR